MAISDNMRGAGLMSLSMFAFTGNDTFMKAVTQSLPLYQTIVLRGAIAVVGILLIAHFTGKLHFRLSRADLKLIGVRSLADVVATVLFLTALQHMQLANLSAIIQAMPLAVTLGAALWYKDAIGWRRMTAILIGFVGVVIIISPGSEGFDAWALLGLASVLAIVLPRSHHRGHASGRDRHPSRAFPAEGARGRRRGAGPHDRGPPWP